jgi:ABC-2 type transport system ATP-binding protein
MPETVPLYLDMTLFDYLKYMADLRYTENAEERVFEVIELMNLEERSDSYISDLSKGLKQRVGLAQALVHDPQVLVLDEPTIGLDPAQIIEVRNLIRDLGKTRTILLSTHILSEAQQVCDRVLIINEGKLVAEDSPENLKSRLSGALHIFIEVGDDHGGIESLINKMEGVNRIISNQNGMLEIETYPGMDPRPELAKAIVSDGYELLEMRKAGLSLEDVFLKLTREETDEVNRITGVQFNSEVDR